MSHPFGELLRQIRARKHGLTQERLAHMIGYDQAVLARMAQGKKDLTGPSGRDRILRLVNVLRDEGVLHHLDEANALLAAADLPPLYKGIPIEATLILQLQENPHPSAQLLSNPIQLEGSPRFSPPAPVSSLIGRSSDIAQVLTLITNNRLVTLTGAGGSGKTRLALEIGWQCAEGFTYGACFVELVTVNTPNDVPAAIANALELSLSEHKSAIDAIRQYLRQKSILLILDNFEHLIGAALYISQILTGAAQVKVLVTSRSPLRISGEYEYCVEPLELPAVTAKPTLSTLSEIAAIQLFIQRAKAVQHRFELNEINAKSIADICRWTDGLPLAIELAAARVRLFTPAELLTRLSQGDERGSVNSALSLFAEGPHDLPSRQRTIQATIDWSYQLLTTDERYLLRWLGVFTGGAEFTEIATFVSDSDQQTITDQLQSLVEKNLVRAVSQADGATRYFLLELIREYAISLASSAGELINFHQRHAQAYLQLIQKARQYIYGKGQSLWTQRLDRDYANIQVALAWCFGVSGDTTLGCQIVGSLEYFWYVGSHAFDGQRWLDLAQSALSKYDELAPTIRGDILVCLANNGSNITRKRGIEICEEVIQHYQRDNNLHGIAMAKCLISEYSILKWPDDAYGAQVLQEAQSLGTEINNTYVIDRTRVIGILRERHLKGDQAVEQQYREAVDIMQRSGNHTQTAQMLCHYANLLLCLLKHDEALAAAEEASRLSKIAHNPSEETWAVGLAAEAARMLGKLEYSLALLEYCLAIAQDQLRDYYVTPILVQIAKTSSLMENHPRARSALHEALNIMRTTVSAPDQNYGSMRDQSYANWVDAAVLFANGMNQPHRAANLYGLANKLWTSDQRKRPNSSEWELERCLLNARNQLGEAAFGQAYAEGFGMTSEEVNYFI